MSNTTWRPVYDLTGLQPATRTAVEADLNASVYDYRRMVPNLQAGNGWAEPTNSIPVQERDLSTFLQEANANGWYDHEHFCAIYIDPDTGKLVDHHIEHGLRGVLESGAAPAPAGLYWYAGANAPAIWIERALSTDFKRAVMSAEKWHAQDFYDLWQTRLYEAISAMMGANDGHIWLPDGQRGQGGTTYPNLHGENYMAWGTRAFDPTVDFSQIQLSHPVSEQQAAQVRALAPWVIQETAPPPPQPPQPPPNPPDNPYPVVELAPGIWDGRSAVSNPLGRLRSDGSVIKMGTLAGQATHHTVTAIVEAFTPGHTLEQKELAAYAKQCGFHLAFDATIEQELEHIRVIDAYHKSLGWGGFAYHGIAYVSGRFWLCGNLDGQRAHVENHNHELHGVALNGDWSTQRPPEGMLIAAGHGMQYIRRETGTNLPINGHRNWTATICPGDGAVINWTPYLGPTEPEPGAPYVVDVFEAPNGFEIRFSGPGTVEVPASGKWWLERIGADGVIDHHIKAPS